MSVDSSPRPSIRVLCIDDHPVFRRGIDLIVEAQDNMRLVASCGSGERGVKLWRALRPDITLMDLELPRMSGLEAIRSIRAEQADARIIVLTMHDEEEVIHGALEMGATTYVLKETASHVLIKVIRQVHEGRSPVQAKVARLLARREAYPELTRREMEVLTRIGSGLTNREIASSFDVTEDTIHKHIGRVFQKLKVNNRTAAVGEAIRRGLLRVK